MNFLRFLVCALFTTVLGCSNGGNYHPPTPGPTPGPTPYSVNASAPPPPATVKWKPGTGSCSGGVGYTGCSEGNCSCGSEGIKGAHGLPFNVSFSGLGSDNPRDILRANLSPSLIDTEISELLDSEVVDNNVIWRYQGRVIARIPFGTKDLFANGGSQNIGLSCRVVKYRKDKDSKWIEGYCDTQLSGDIGIGGTEANSGMYDSVTIGNLIVAKFLAHQFGHSVVENKIGDLLRRKLGLQTLMAQKQPVLNWHSIFYDEFSTGKDVDITIKADNPSGPGTNFICNRIYGNGGAGSCDGVQHTFLAILYDMPDRKNAWKYSTDAGHSGRPVCAPFHEMHLDIEQDGHVDLARYTVSPEFFGFDSVTQFQGRQFLESNGTRYLNELISWNKDSTFDCDLWILRTKYGITVANIHADGSETRVCSGTKGGSIPIATLEGTTSHTVSRITHQNSPEAAWVYRSGPNHDGGFVCEKSDQRPEKCVALATGWNNSDDVIYELVWPAHGKLQIVRANHQEIP